MLLLLQVCQAAGLGVNILNLSRAVLVEGDDALAGGGAGSLLKVRAQAAKETLSPRGNAVGLVRSLRAVGGVVLLVEVLEGAEEAARDAVLGVKLDGALESGISDDVALGEVLGQDARAGLLLLSDLVGITVRVVLEVGAVVAGVAAGTGNGNVGGAKLSVIQQEGSLSSSLLLEGDGGILGLAGGGDLNVCDLAAAVC